MYISILSISFQTAGSLILLIKYIGNTNQKIIDEYFGRGIIADNDEHNNAIIGVCSAQKCRRIIHDNRISFLYLTIGYFLSILGTNIVDDAIREFVCVMCITVLLIIIEKICQKIQQEQ